MRYLLFILLLFINLKVAGATIKAQVYELEVDKQTGLPVQPYLYLYPDNRYFLYGLYLIGTHEFYFCIMSVGTYVKKTDTLLLSDQYNHLQSTLIHKNAQTLAVVKSYNLLNGRIFKYTDSTTDVHPDTVGIYELGSDAFKKASMLKVGKIADGVYKWDDSFFITIKDNSYTFQMWGNTISEGTILHTATEAIFEDKKLNISFSVKQRTKGEILTHHAPMFPGYVTFKTKQ